MERITVVSNLNAEGKRTAALRAGRTGKEYSPLGEADLRREAIRYMIAMASVKWTANDRFDYSFNNKLLVYEPGQTYYGVIYNNNRNGLEAFTDAIDENGVLHVKDTGWDSCPGNSCATSIRHAWQLVSPEVEFNYCIDMMPVGPGKGMAPVGKIRWDLYDGKNTTESILKNMPEEDVLEAYIAAKPGDGMVRYLDTGGHALMVTKEPYVKRDRNGIINKDESTLFLTDQNNLLNTTREYLSSWKIDKAVTFTKALECGWLPVSLKVFREGRAEKAYVKAYGAPTEESLAKKIDLLGELKSNYCFVNVSAKLTRGRKTIASVTVHPYERTFSLRKLRFGKTIEALQSGSYKLTLTAKAGVYEFEPLSVSFQI